MIAWCGSSSEGLGWLKTRCTSLDHVATNESLSIAALDTICQKHPRRLILAVENRISYPIDEINHLQRTWPEVPWALAVGTWFDGSRRTGIGPQNHLCLPWYRWWDAWKPWINGTNAESLNPWPRMTYNVESAAAKAHHTDTPQTTLGTLPGIIISSCKETGAGWKAALESSGHNSARRFTVEILSVQQFRSKLGQATNDPPAWILWDDTSSNTFAGAEGLCHVCLFFESIRKLYPHVLIIAATSMPRWSLWQAWMAAGADELLAKPIYGVQLSELAQHLNRLGEQPKAGFLQSIIS